MATKHDTTNLPASVAGSSISFLVYLRTIQDTLGRKLSYAEKEKTADAFLADLEVHEACLWLQNDMPPAEMPPALQRLLDKRQRSREYNKKRNADLRRGGEPRQLTRRLEYLRRLVVALGKFRG
jgi:hypothetical protein